MGIFSVLSVSQPDKESLPAKLADRAICIGPPLPKDSYLKIEYLITAAKGTGCDAIHPGYGFLSERQELVDACKKNDLIFVGPSSENIRQMGNKLIAREIARQCGLPTIPGSPRVERLKDAIEATGAMGLPVMIKAAAGGGGRGMAIIETMGQLQSVFDSLSFEVYSAFGDGSLFLERYFPNARHVEVQIIGDRFGRVIHLFERDCSVQRRHQKVVEETPCPILSAGQREDITKAAVELAKSIGYESCGTVEFILDQDTGRFYFLEMNTRLQVEHPITEEITGVDIVKEQIRIADGLPLEYSQDDIRMDGHAIECRINAESCDRDFAPCPGLIETWRPPQGEGIRLETHCFSNYTVPPFYDSLLGKLVVKAKNREQAIILMQSALKDFVVQGINSNIPFHISLFQHPDFLGANINTTWLEKFFMPQVNLGGSNAPG
jgi:acetyl-CoA carboxylase biotin carboxylase subunit